MTEQTHTREPGRCEICNKKMPVPSWKHCDGCGVEKARRKARERYILNRDKALAYGKAWREARNERRRLAKMQDALQK